LQYKDAKFKPSLLSNQQPRFNVEVRMVVDGSEKAESGWVIKVMEHQDV
jgi:hypothetical protein